MPDDKLFQYYERQDVLPTFGNFKSPAQLDAYAAQRRELFADRLMFPPAVVWIDALAALPCATIEFAAID